MKKMNKKEGWEIIKKYGGCYLDFEEHQVIVNPANGKHFVPTGCKFTDNYEEIKEMEGYGWDFVYWN